MPEDFIPRFSDEYQEGPPTHRPSPSQQEDQQPDIPWFPMARGGSNFGTHRLRETNSGRLEFKPTAGAHLFGAIFTVIGLATLGAGVLAIQSTGTMFEGAWIPLLIGLVFAGVGIPLWRAMAQPIIFDLGKQLFWRGKRPKDLSGQSYDKKWARLQDVEGVQLLAEQVSGSESRYYSYEINLLMSDGKRVHVVDHGDASRIRKDAHKLAHFLSVPFYEKP